MADSFLDNAGGFTPVPDKLVRDYGFEVAYVWGKVWRYCQMQSGACTASHETIAKRAGMSRRTLIDKLNILIEAGYIEDKTPDLKNKPHTYCTKKGEVKITSAMQISHTENDMSLQDDNELGMRNLHSDNADNAQPDTPTMQNLHPKRVSSLSLESKPIQESKLSPQQKMFLALAELSHIDLKVASPKQRGQIDQASQALTKTVSDVDLFKIKFNIYWTKIDWRGKQGQAPTPAQIREIYGDYCHWLDSGEGIPVYAQKASTNGTHRQNNQQPSDRLATRDKSAHDAELEALANPRPHPK